MSNKMIESEARFQRVTVTHSVTVLSDLFFHIFVNLTITVVPIAILNFISSVQFASFLTFLPKYTKESTYSSRPPATKTKKQTQK